jgi:hypothetical protein
MKKRFFALIFAAIISAAIPLAQSGCQTAPNARVQTVTTLKVVGASVDATMRLGAQLLRDGKITRAQWDQLAVIHDAKFQPAFNLAVSAVQANLDSVASPDLLALSSQLAALISSFQTPAKSP